MGEIADMMIDGELCEQCGGFVDPPLGYPGECNECRAERGAQKHERYRNVDAEFPDACRLASGCELTLRRHTWQHYSLRGTVCGERFQLNLYPGNQRLYCQDKNLGYVKIEQVPWTLIGVVRAVVDHIAKRERAES